MESTQCKSIPQLIISLINSLPFGTKIKIFANLSFFYWLFLDCWSYQKTKQPMSLMPKEDFDHDGVTDIVDLDDDNDGIPDNIECSGFVGNYQISVINGGFELPIMASTLDSAAQVWRSGQLYAAAYHQDDIPGWTTDDSRGQIEIWQNGFIGRDSYAGDQHGEINAHENATLFQTIATVPGEQMRYSFAHRGRAGVDTIELLAGVPGDPLLSLGEFSHGFRRVGSLHRSLYRSSWNKQPPNLHIGRFLPLPTTFRLEICLMKLCFSLFLIAKLIQMKMASQIVKI